MILLVSLSDFWFFKRAILNQREWREETRVNQSVPFLTDQCLLSQGRGKSCHFHAGDKKWTSLMINGFIAYVASAWTVNCQMGFSLSLSIWRIEIRQQNKSSVDMKQVKSELSRANIGLSSRTRLGSRFSATSHLISCSVNKVREMDRSLQQSILS